MRDRTSWTLRGGGGEEGAGHEQSHQQSPFYRSVTADISHLLFHTQEHCCCSLYLGEGGLVMEQNRQTVVNITGFYSTVRCCNHGGAVAPRCLSGFDCEPNQSVQHINVFVIGKEEAVIRMIFALRPTVKLAFRRGNANFCLEIFVIKDI